MFARVCSSGVYLAENDHPADATRIRVASTMAKTSLASTGRSAGTSLAELRLTKPPASATNVSIAHPKPNSRNPKA